MPVLDGQGAEKGSKTHAWERYRSGKSSAGCTTSRAEGEAVLYLQRETGRGRGRGRNSDGYDGQEADQGHFELVGAQRKEI